VVITGGCQRIQIGAGAKRPFTAAAEGGNAQRVVVVVAIEDPRQLVVGGGVKRIHYFSAVDDDP
jgi:hypothetical protein